METYLQNFITKLSLTDGASPLTAQSYMRYLSRFFSVANISHPRKITEQKIQDFRLALHNENKKKQTINCYLIALRQFLKHLKKQGIETLDFSLIELSKQDERKIEVLTNEDAEKLFAEAKNNSRAYAILKCLYSTGLRVHELAALPKELKLTAEGGYTVLGKGGRTRLVYFGEGAREAIRAYAPTIDGSTDPRLFPIALGNIKKIVRKVANRAGFKGKRIGAHAFRHLFATTLRRNKVDIRVVQTMLGHKSIASTQIYDTVVNEETRHAHALLTSFG